jgi:hypothetical protein
MISHPPRRVAENPAAAGPIGLVATRAGIPERYWTFRVFPDIGMISYLPSAERVAARHAGTTSAAGTRGSRVSD